jgi:hypothetical protein
MQNAFIESFNGRLRDELLNETLFISLTQARVALECWRADYNDARPHSQLGWRTPAEFAFTFHPRRDLTLRYAEGSAPAPVATTAQPGNPTAKANSGPDKTWGKVTRPHPPPRSRPRPRDLACLLRRRARGHDRAMCRQSRRGPEMAMALWFLSGLEAWRVATVPPRRSRPLARPLRRPAGYSCRAVPRLTFRHGASSKHGPQRSTSASIAVNGCRRIGRIKINFPNVSLGADSAQIRGAAY